MEIKTTAKPSARLMVVLSILISSLIGCAVVLSGCFGSPAHMYLKERERELARETPTPDYAVVGSSPSPHR